jgi:hypothetical protein
VISGDTCPICLEDGGRTQRPLDIACGFEQSSDRFAIENPLLSRRATRVVVLLQAPHRVAADQSAPGGVTEYATKRGEGSTHGPRLHPPTERSRASGNR